MANITAAQVKELRDMTDSPMMECKKALVEAEGDMDLAVDILRKNGLAAAAKKAGRATNEGAIGAYVSEDGTLGAHRRGRLRDRLRGLQPHVHRLRCQARRASSPRPSPLPSRRSLPPRWTARPSRPRSPSSSTSSART